jgi:6-phosphogluconolactonase
VRVIVAEAVEDAARIAADELTRACAAAIAARGRAVIAVSGGSTPWLMLREFVSRALPWPSIVVAQVDERRVPRTDERRNLTRLEQILVRDGTLPSQNVLAIPVEAPSAAEAARRYEHALVRVAGAPPVFDLVQLGLGEDGHTASLVPEDPVLEIADRAVGIARSYQGTERVTLTFPTLDRARERMWLVTGAAKTRALAALIDGTGPTPAVRITRAATVVIADRAAAPGSS